MWKHIGAAHDSRSEKYRTLRRRVSRFAFIIMLGAYGWSSAGAREGQPASASLLGPLTAQPTSVGMSITGTIRNVPSGTKIWVSIYHQPGGPPKPVFVAEDSNVIVAPDGTFHANILDPAGSAFKAGSYVIWIESHFNSGWQTIDVLRKAGVELDSQGRSDIDTDPKAIPQSPDFIPNDPEFPTAGRYIHVIREVKLGALPGDLAAIDAVKGSTLLVQGSGRSSLPVGKSIEWFARAGGFKPIAWSAARDPNGNWIVTLDCVDGEKQTKAQWSYDPRSRTVKYIDHLAKTVSYVPPD